MKNYFRVKKTNGRSNDYFSLLPSFLSHSFFFPLIRPLLALSIYIYLQVMPFFTRDDLASNTCIIGYFPTFFFSPLYAFSCNIHFSAEKQTFLDFQFYFVITNMLNWYCDLWIRVLQRIVDVQHALAMCQIEHILTGFLVCWCPNIGHFSVANQHHPVIVYLKFPFSSISLHSFLPSALCIIKFERRLHIRIKLKISIQFNIFIYEYENTSI